MAYEELEVKEDSGCKNEEKKKPDFRLHKTVCDNRSITTQELSKVKGSLPAVHLQDARGPVHHPPVLTPADKLVSQL